MSFLNQFNQYGQSNTNNVSSAFSPVQFIHKIARTDLSECFNINAPQFLSLANPEQFSALKNTLVQIDIQEALQFLTPASYLEISLPTVGMIDFLAIQQPQSIWNQMPQPFASVMAINGFGGGAFSRPDAIMATDIIGNQYEILVDQHGQVEIPQEGMGLFSMLSDLTLWYTPEQVVAGQGLSGSQQSGAKAKQLYFLPPVNSDQPFAVVVRVSHLDEYNNRQVDFEQKCQFVVSPDPNVSEERAGLSVFGARTLIRSVFSEFDLMRCLLSDETGERFAKDFFISHEHHFNDFNLSPEAIGPYYDLLLAAVIYQQIPSEFILSKVPDARASSIDLSYAPLDKQDQALVKQMSIYDLFQLLPRNPDALFTPTPPAAPEGHSGRRLFKR